MTKTLYIPALDDKIRLVHDLVIPQDTLNEYKNRDFGMMLNGHPRHAMTQANWSSTPYLYKKRLPNVSSKADGTIPAGTVISFHKLDLNRAKKEQFIEIKVFASPDLSITPKKHGGTGDGTVKLRLPLSMLNGLEYEEFNP